MLNTYRAPCHALPDLRSIAARSGFSNLASSGLRAIVQASCSFELKKDTSIQCSNWDEPLSAAQIEYAAADAIYSRRAFLYFFHLMRERNWARKSAPPSTMPGEISAATQQEVDSSCLAAPSSAHPAAGGLLYSFIQGIVDVAIPVARPLSSQSSTKSSSASCANERAQAKLARQSEFWKTHARKSSLYENCRILAPSGVLMCNANKKKLQWYLDRGLADEIDDATIRLKFEPKGLGHAGDQFYLESKQNACVSCGASDQVVRHSIVPHSFRTHLPGMFTTLIFLSLNVV